LYLPSGPDFGERLANHCANLNSMKWMLWNDGVEMADFGMTNLRICSSTHSPILTQAVSTLKGSKQS
jgi:hypothetical protein